MCKPFFIVHRGGQNVYKAGYVYLFLGTPNAAPHLIIFHLSLFIIGEKVLIAIALCS